MSASNSSLLPEQPSRLLVVDDEFNNRLAMSRRLERRGYAVDTAEGAEDALEKLFREHYDLVLLDQMMPGMNGVDLLRLLRATYSPTELPVIMVTAVDENETIVEALEEGANDYVVKPVEMPEITARIQTQLSRARSGRKRESKDAAWDWDPKRGVARYSAEWAALVGHKTEEISDTLEEWLDRIHPQDLVRVRKELKDHLESGSVEFRSEHRLRCKTGAYRWVICKAVALKDGEGQLIRLAGSLNSLDHAPSLDALTGLENRLQMLDRLASNLQKATEGEKCAVMLVDVDNFSVLNEHSGHEAADRILVETAARLKDALDGMQAGAEMVARVGSDEFAILLACPRGAADVQFLAEVLLASFDEPMTSAPDPEKLTVSIGAAISVSGATADQMLRDADLALRKAKEQGGNNWKLYESSLRDRAHVRATLVRDLRHVIDRNQLLVLYQPKVHLRTGAVVGFEALMRWRHPELGMISPADFIPMAEETGIILQAGEWILRRSCKQLKAWQEEFGELEMSVNLSARQLSDANLVQIVERALADARVEPGSLALELTESSLIEEKDTARAKLGELQKLGVRLMLDDFGTRYASLSYLSMLRFDALKIDRSFVSHMDADPDRLAIVRTILGLARELRMGVVAEGIETEVQLRQLLELGCETGQGYYYSKPVEEREAHALLSRGFAAFGEASEIKVA